MDDELRGMLTRAVALQTEASAILTSLLIQIGDPGPVAPDPDQPDLPETVECQHPPESRIDTATMGHVGAFRCRDCGYVYSGAESTGG